MSGNTENRPPVAALAVQEDHPKNRFKKFLIFCNTFRKK